MSTTLSITYAQGRSVKVKAAPMTTLQSVVSEACGKIPNSAHPESYQLIHNKKALDLSLPVRFANLPQGATLTLKRVSSGGPAATSSSNSQKVDSSRRAQQLIKVALQIVGGSRVINDFEPSTTLWDIVYSAETESRGTLNLTARYREGPPGVSRNGATPSSPLESMQRAVFGPMQSLYNSVSGSSSSSRASTPGSGSPSSQKLAAPTTRVYQQPVLQFLGHEVASFEEMQATTLRSLGFTSGQALIRLFFKDAPKPAALPSPPMKTAPLQEQQQDEAPKAENKEQKVRPRVPSPPSKDESVPAVKKPTPEKNASLAKSAEPPSSNGLVPRRHVQVFGNSAAGPSAPVQIVLPESFYDPSSSDDASLLIKAQRARLVEADREFKMRSTEEKKRLEQREKFKHNHPTTVIRFRFPDTTHVQATFASTEPIGELFIFVQSILGDRSQVLQTLVMQPPVQDLKELTATSLFDAKMTPAAVVHVELQSNAINKHSSSLDLLRPEIAALAQPLTENYAPAALESDQHSNSNDDATTNATLDHMLPSSSAASRTSSSRTSGGEQQQRTAAQGTKMPKWFLAGQKKR
ncbi:hypothetical protein IW140_005959 [Coemansia sp. RSA 1813]|nr:hypothetical protein EV178_005965 [Coemansia sp. RSA 1646]KAJ1764816.1 hypothetical protein LPJ74_006564 [Coemansia sp. RSA 1843]KAJ2086094.1 hypothetical protein IW138_005914 [Coemansia sp. RSA 986]KAJ2211017.1 hypothetical protein EV179_005823 [Coemansia sp. RSA 487]KAJ2563871.1 hypothetical protein IW140_005959 [Coemansia sp. RSA 1813]